MIPFTGSRNATRIVDKALYCGTPSQESEVQYFPDKNAYQNWIDYRQIDGFNAADARQRGILVFEMGQRQTSGFKIKLDPAQTGISKSHDTLIVRVDTIAPRQDAAVGQAMTTPCVAIRPAAGSYERIKVVDRLGNTRGIVNVSR